MIIGIIFLVAGWFIADIIFGTLATVMSVQIKKDSAGKTVIMVLGIIEIVLVVLGIIIGLI